MLITSQPNQDVKKQDSTIATDSEKSLSLDMVPAILSDKDRNFFNKVIVLVDNLTQKRMYTTLVLNNHTFSYQINDSGGGGVAKINDPLLVKEFKKSLKKDFIANYPASQAEAITIETKNEYDYQMDLADTLAQTYLLPEIAKLQPDFHQFVALYKTWDHPLGLHREVLTRLHDKEQFAQIFVMPMYYKYALHSYLNHQGFLGNQLAYPLNCYQRHHATDKFSEEEIIELFFHYLKNNPEIKGKINHFQILKDFRNILSQNAIHQIIERLGENPSKPLLTMNACQTYTMEINYASLYRSEQFENLDEISTFLWMTEKQLKTPLGLEVLKASSLQMANTESNECVNLYIQAKTGMNIEMNRLQVLLSILVDQARNIIFFKEEKMMAEVDKIYEEILKKHLFYFNLDESISANTPIEDQEESSKQFKI